MAFSDYSTTPDNNGTVLGVSIAEQCPPGNVNNAIRQLCADMRTAIDPTLDEFLASTSLAAARENLGVTEGGTSQNNFSALTNAANKLPYMTGSDNWATTDFTSFARSVVATGDAAALLALLGITATASSGTFGANSVSVSIPLGSGGTLLVQAGTGTIGGDTSGSITFGTEYSVAPVCIVSGGDSDASHEGDTHTVGAATTTGQAIENSNGAGSITYSWFAIGKA